MEKDEIWDTTNSLPVILYKSDDGKTKVDVIFKICHKGDIKNCIKNWLLTILKIYVMLFL